jgi:tRNA(His) guanylyltransferase
MEDSLGDRMKGYEAIPKQTLMRRTPVIVRLDGRAFHTFARGVEKPFDNKLADAMKLTASALVKEVQNCVMAYTQSDEISLLLIDYEEINTDAWFANDLQKMVSIASSFCTGIFNANYKHKNGAIAVFDARAFNIPKEEVNNYFIWRQQDCSRNSVSQTARAYFSHKSLHNKKRADMIKMLEDNGTPYSAIPQGYQLGWITTGPKDPVIAAPSFIEDRNLITNFVYTGIGLAGKTVVEDVETMPLSPKMQEMAKKLFGAFDKQRATVDDVKWAVDEAMIKLSEEENEDPR